MKTLKANLIKILSLVLVLAFMMSGVICASAAKYVSKPVAENFETKTNFLIPGDLDADGALNKADYKNLRTLILQDSSAEYSDVNGDGDGNICDLVLQDANANSDFIADGKMNLNGKSVYNAEITSLLNTGAEYKVAFTTTGDVEVNLIGLTDNQVITSGDTFKTPLNLSNVDLELYVIGQGTIENLQISRINMDNDYAVN